MTTKFLADYYNKHQYLYTQLANECTSVPELQLKLMIFGKQWCQWDWSLFLIYIANINKVLCHDIIEAIDTSNTLDSVFTNKQVIEALIHCAHQFKHARIVLTILAHTFKKFPSLWNMNWMWSKRHDSYTNKLSKLHKMKVFVAKNIDNKYYMTSTYYNDFIKTYYNNQLDGNQLN